MSALPPKATLDASFRMSANQKRTYAAQQEGSLFDHRASADEQVKKSQGARLILNSGDRRPLPAAHPVVHHAVLALGPQCP